MSSSTWNFPCWITRDFGPTGSRQTGGTQFQIGPGSIYASNNDPLPFTNAITVIGSFFSRTGWSSQDNNLQTILSIGTASMVLPALWLPLVGISGVSRVLNVKLWDGVGAVTRYDVDTGDEDGINWLQEDKWYQYAISADTSGIQIAMNGTTSPTTTVTTNVPGSLNLDFGTERFWMYSPSAARAGIDPVAQVEWPSVMVGTSAMHSTALDLSSSTVLDRIYDADGNFKNPGENGSGWFGEYDATVPDYFFLDGSPRRLTGWGVKDGGVSGIEGCPGGLRKQYES